MWREPRDTSGGERGDPPRHRMRVATTDTRAKSQDHEDTAHRGRAPDPRRTTPGTEAQQGQGTARRAPNPPRSEDTAKFQDN
eukprot:5909407-Alexandrium_andersonii.AAC.1